MFYFRRSINTNMFFEASEIDHRLTVIVVSGYAVTDTFIGPGGRFFDGTAYIV